MKSTKDLSLRQELRSTAIMFKQESQKYDSYHPDADASYLSQLGQRLYDLRCRALQKGYSNDEISSMENG